MSKEIKQPLRFRITRDNLPEIFGKLLLRNILDKNHDITIPTLIREYGETTSTFLYLTINRNNFGKVQSTHDGGLYHDLHTKNDVMEFEYYNNYKYKPSPKITSTCDTEYILTKFNKDGEDEGLVISESSHIDRSEFITIQTYDRFKNMVHDFPSLKGYLNVGCKVFSVDSIRKFIIEVEKLNK